MSNRVLGEKSVKEVIGILATAIVLAFIVNSFSPIGIALKGDWDTAGGVVSARSKLDVVVHDIEIPSLFEAKEIFDAGTTLFLDSRQHDAYEKGYIKGAVSLSVYRYDELIDAFIDQYPPDQKIITYCSGRECDESHRLATYLKAEGYLNVRVFIDGFPAWEKEGFPVEKKSEDE